MAKKKEAKLNAEKRILLGRKVKSLRRDGILPANVFGKDVKSLAIKLPASEFTAVYEETGETGIIELSIKGETKTRPVLVGNVAVNPVTDAFLHADFRQVDLKAKITAEIPIELIGESLAVKEKVGILIQPLSVVDVEALPTDFPESLELDISSLKKVDDSLSVSDLKLPGKIKVLTSAEEILAKINPLAEEEKAPEPAPVEGEEEVEDEGEEEVEDGEGKEGQKEKGVGQDQEKDKGSEEKKLKPAKN